MSSTSFSFVAVVALLLSFAPLSAQEQVKVDSIEVKKVEVDTQRTPEFSIGGAKDKKTPRSREWIEMDVEFLIKGKSSSNDYLDQLTVKYYVMLADKETMLTATVQYVNIPMNEEIWGAVYIAPSTIEKILGKGNANANLVAGYAVEVLQAGEIKGGDASPKATGANKWWRARQGTDGVLLPRAKTPYKHLWYDRYAEEKPAG